MTSPTHKIGAKLKFGPKTGIATLASTLVLTNFIAAQQATAQEGEQITEEVVVTGVRQSLMNAQDIKQNADTFVDAISASDIGALPDRSVLEALSRLPGVSVERFASPEDPDRFSSEGSGAVVRGMTATRTEFNGRDSFTASSARGLSFEDISPELMSAVKLYKNQTADMIEGGIGGTVSMHTRKPFEQDGSLFAFSIDYTHFDLSEREAPSYSALYSNRFDTDVGEFGALISLAHGESEGQADNIQAAYYQDINNTSGAHGPSPTDMIRVPSGGALGTKLDLRERKGAAISLQYENPSDTFLGTFDYIRSDSSLKWMERKVSVLPYDGRAGRFTVPAEGTAWTFDDSGTFTNGVLAHGNDGWRGHRWEEGTDGNPPNGYDNLRLPDGPANPDNCYSPTDEVIEDGDCNLRSATFGQESDTTSRIQWSNTLVEDYSLNLKYNPSKRWEIVADFQYVDAQSYINDMQLTTSFYGLNYLEINGTGVPRMALINPWEVVPDENYHPGPDADLYDTIGNLTELEANAPGAVPIDRYATDYFAQPSSYYWNNASDEYMRATGEEIAVRLDATYFIEDSMFTAVKMGVRQSQREQEVRDVGYSNWGSLMRQRDLDDLSGEHGYAAGWLDLVDQPYDTVDWSNFYRGDGTYMGNATLNGGNVTPIENSARYSMIHPSFDLIENYRDWENLLNVARVSSQTQAWEPAYLRDENNDGVVDTQGYFLPEELSDVKETNQAVYVRIDYQWEDFKFPITGNVGVRYYQVELESTGYISFPDLVPTITDPENPDYYGSVLNFLPEDDTAFGNNSTLLTFAENDYGHVLPSFNLKMQFTDTLLGRFAVSKAVALPDIGDLRSFIDISAQTESEDLPNDPNDTLENRQIDPETARVSNYSARGGNPYLVPMESVQWDLSAEWYFDDVGSLTASIFYKDLKNFFVDGAFARPVTNPDTGVTKDVNVSGLLNAGDGSLRGFEIAYQQFYDMLPAPFDGVGLQLNYTWIDVNGVPNPALEGAEDLRGQEVVQELPLQSQSEHTANAVLMYQKYDWDFRLAYNWRSEYLLTARDGSNRPYPATWAGDAGYLDASLFYNITDAIKIGFQGNNLTDTITRTEFQNNYGPERDGRSWFMLDRRYTFVVRAVF